MTLPASGNILLGTAGGGNSVNSEFGYGNDMASYLGVYYGKGTQEFRFPLPGNSIGMNGFYSTFKITGSNTYLGTGYWTVPVYNTLYAQVKGGDGGGAGQWGYNACTGQATGSAGGQNGTGSSFGGMFPQVVVAVVAVMEEAVALAKRQAHHLLIQFKEVLARLLDLKFMLVQDLAVAVVGADLNVLIMVFIACALQPLVVEDRGQLGMSMCLGHDAP